MLQKKNGTSEHHHCGSCWRQQFKRKVIATEPRRGTPIGKVGISCQVLGRKSQGKALTVRAISHQACALSLGISGATCLAGTFSFHWKVKCTKAESRGLPWCWETGPTGQIRYPKVDISMWEADSLLRRFAT